MISHSKNAYSWSDEHDLLLDQFTYCLPKYAACISQACPSFSVAPTQSRARLVQKAGLESILKAVVALASALQDMGSHNAVAKKGGSEQFPFADPQGRLQPPKGDAAWTQTDEYTHVMGECPKLLFQNVHATRKSEPIAEPRKCLQRNRRSRHI